MFDKVKSPYLPKSARMVIGDILDGKSVKNTAQKADIIYNFTALSDIEEAALKPIDTVRTNIIGNMNILEAARKV